MAVDQERLCVSASNSGPATAGQLQRDLEHLGASTATTLSSTFAGFDLDGLAPRPALSPSARFSPDADEPRAPRDDPHRVHRTPTRPASRRAIRPEGRGP